MKRKRDAKTRLKYDDTNQRKSRAFYPSGVFPNQESLLKLYYLALERIAKKWTMPIHDWGEALNRFVIEFGDRVPQPD